MKKFTEDEVMLLEMSYDTFMDDYDVYCFDTDRYDFEELKYQRNHLKDCDIDSCEFHGRYGEYMSKVISFNEMLGMPMHDVKDAILDKLRGSFANILSSEELSKKYEECKAKSPSAIREKELYGDNPALEVLMKNMMF